MYSGSERVRRVSGALLLVGAVACFAAAGCSDFTPAPDDEGGGMIESPTHEADTLREDEHQEEGGRQ